MKIFITAVFLLITSLLLGSTMEVHKTDGTTLSIELSDINNITFITNSSYNEPLMFNIAAGTFNMGQDGIAIPVHQISLTNSFSIGGFEITNQEYADILTYALSEGLLTEYDTWSTVKNLNGEQQELLNADGSGCDIYYNTTNFAVISGKENFPAANITWYGAAFYCNMLSRQNSLVELYNLTDWSCDVYPTTGASYRLPTTAEWEFVARYNDDRIYPWGNEVATSSYANFNNDIGERTIVGAYSPLGDNQHGICDMTGNVFEWCNDNWSADYYGVSPNTNPEGVSTSDYKCIRGGAYNSTSVEASQRIFSFPTSSSNGIGFRILRTSD